MEFRSYIKARMYFQQCKEKSNAQQLGDIGCAVLDLKKREVLELNLIEDLLLDIEVAIDQRLGEDASEWVIEGQARERKRLSRGRISARATSTGPKIIEATMGFVNFEPARLVEEIAEISIPASGYSLRVYDIKKRNILEEVKKDLCLQVLDKSRGNVSVLAKFLGVTPKAAYDWLKRYGISAQDYRKR